MSTQTDRLLHECAFARQPVHRYTELETVWYRALLTQQSCGCRERGRCSDGERQRLANRWNTAVKQPHATPPSLCPSLFPLPSLPTSLASSHPSFPHFLLRLSPLLPSILICFQFFSVFTFQRRVHFSVWLPSVSPPLLRILTRSKQKKGKT